MSPATKTLWCDMAHRRYGKSRPFPHFNVDNSIRLRTCASSLLSHISVGSPRQWWRCWGTLRGTGLIANQLIDLKDGKCDWRHTMLLINRFQLGRNIDVCSKRCDIDVESSAAMSGFLESRNEKKDIGDLNPASFILKRAFSWVG